MIAVFIESAPRGRLRADFNLPIATTEDRQRDRCRIFTRRPDPFKVNRWDGSSGFQLGLNMPAPMSVCTRDRTSERQHDVSPCEQTLGGKVAAANALIQAWGRRRRASRRRAMTGDTTATIEILRAESVSKVNDLGCGSSKLRNGPICKLLI
jgi:hypothetical protein